MRKLFLIAIIFFSITANAQLQSVHIEENYVVYKAKEGNVDVGLYFHKDTNPSEVDINVLTQLINYTNVAIQSTLKSQRSFVPLSYTYKFKPNKKGKTAKDKHSLTMVYEGTNSYGGVVEDIAQLEFNAKLKETAGSLMLRM